MPSSGPTVSVVLNTYNRAEVVPRAVDSLLAQEFDDFEVVVVDDGSTDDTEAVIAAYGDPRVRYVRRPNGGLAVARNTGLARSSGRFVAFMDDDDEVRPQWLARLVAELDRSAGCGGDGPGAVAVVTCGTEIRTVDGAVATTCLPERLGPAFESQRALFLAGTFIVRRDVLEAVGGYLEELRCSEQTELALRVLPYCHDHGLQVRAVPEPLVVTNRGGEADRPLRRADYLHDGALLLLERHGDRLRRSRTPYVRFATIAAVQGARLGRYGEARRLLWEVVRTEPRQPRHYARLALAAVPPLGRRVWGTWRPDADAPPVGGSAGPAA